MVSVDEVAAGIGEGAGLRDAGAGHGDADELVRAVVGVRCDRAVGSGGSGDRVGLVDGGDVAEGVHDVGFPGAGGVGGGDGVAGIAGGGDAAVGGGGGELAARGVVGVSGPHFGFAGAVGHGDFDHLAERRTAAGAVDRVHRVVDRAVVPGLHADRAAEAVEYGFAPLGRGIVVDGRADAGSLRVRTVGVGVACYGAID